MDSTLSTIGTILISVLAVCVIIYVLYRRGTIGRFKGIRIPSGFKSEVKTDTRIEQLNAQTEKEVAKAEELRNVLEAKRELAKARAENIRLKKEIGGVSEKSVEKERREQQEKAEEEQKEVQPKRL